MIRERLPESVRCGSPGWRWRWWMENEGCELPTNDEIDELTSLVWGRDMRTALAGASVETYAPNPRAPEVKIRYDIEWGCVARELGYPVAPVVVQAPVDAPSITRQEAEPAFSLRAFGFNIDTHFQCWAVEVLWNGEWARIHSAPDDPESYDSTKLASVKAYYADCQQLAPSITFRIVGIDK